MLENALFLGLLIGACFGLGVAVLALRLRARDTQDTAPGTDPMMEKIIETVEQMARAQSELTGRLDGMAATQETARSELTRTLTEQLTTVSKTVADNLKDTGERTTRTLGDLGQRLSLIDKAQQEITALSGQVVELQQILDNKQARGAFGGRNWPILCATGCPKPLTRFSTRCRTGGAPTVSSTCQTRRGWWWWTTNFRPRPISVGAVRKQTKRRRPRWPPAYGLQKHATDIAERYIIPGETADAALMFSESVFSELHSRLPDLVDKCRAMHVYRFRPTRWH